MKTTILLLLAALTLPLMAERQLTVTWDKYPERNEIIIKSGDKELGNILVNPDDPKLESITVTIPDGKVTLVAIARNVGGESEPSEPLVIPAAPANPRGLKITTIIRTTISLPTP
jgi:hypothetical protein